MQKIFKANAEDNLSCYEDDDTVMINSVIYVFTMTMDHVQQETTDRSRTVNGSQLHHSI